MPQQFDDAPHLEDLTDAIISVDGVRPDFASEERVDANPSGKKFNPAMVGLALAALPALYGFGDPHTDKGISSKDLINGSHTAKKRDEIDILGHLDQPWVANQSMLSIPQGSILSMKDDRNRPGTILNGKDAFANFIADPRKDKGTSGHPIVKEKKESEAQWSAPPSPSYITAAQPEQPSPWTMLGAYTAVGAAFLGLGLYLQQRNQRRFVEAMRPESSTQGNSSQFHAGNFDLEALPKLRLEHVGGIGEVRDQLKDDLELFRRYKAGEDVRIPRCIFFAGPTGVGKTRIARAIAGELGVPFTELEGTSLMTHTFVGDGLGRIEKALEKEHKRGVAFQAHLRKQPGATGKERGLTLLFLDEAERLMLERTEGGGGNGENASTTNKFLSVADNTNPVYANVILIAATNKPDLLDEAVKRPGRFRVVHINRPAHLEQRLEIIDSLVPEVLTEREFSLGPECREWLGNASSGSTGAYINLVLEEASNLAERAGRKEINLADLSEAFFRSQKDSGRVKALKVPVEEQIATMVHEVGHGVWAYLIGATIDYISGLPRGTRLGVLGFSIPEGWEYHQSYEILMNVNMLSLGGRAAEIIVKGLGGISTGASSDYQHVKEGMQHLLSVGLLGDHYDFGAGIKDGETLQPHHRDRINMAIGACEKAAYDVLNALGKEWLLKTATDLVNGKRELVGQEAHQYIEERIGDKAPELFAIVNRSIESFVYSKFGPGWREAESREGVSAEGDSSGNQYYEPSHGKLVPKPISSREQS